MGRFGWILAEVVGRKDEDGRRVGRGRAAVPLAFACLMLPSTLSAAVITYTGTAVVTQSDFATVPVNATMTFTFSWDDTSPNHSWSPDAAIAFDFGNGRSASSSGNVAIQASTAPAQFSLSSGAATYSGFSYVDKLYVILPGPFSTVPSDLSALTLPGYGPLWLILYSYYYDPSPTCSSFPTPPPSCEIDRFIRANAVSLERAQASPVSEPVSLVLTGLGVAVAMQRGRKRRRAERR